MPEEIEDNPVKNSENPCDGCSLCCEYVAIELDDPETKEDYDEIRWYLVHKNVWVFIDHDDSWNIQFNTSCEKLDERKWCSIYDKRPTICGKHSSDNCDKYGEGDSFKILWKTLEEFDEWFQKNPEGLKN